MAQTAKRAARATTPTSLNSRLKARAGYSLLEMMIALAIMGLAAAIIVPRGAAALDQVVVHSVFFDFQRQISDLRATAFADQQSYDLTSSQEAPRAQIVILDDRTNDPAQNITLSLRAGWQYRVSHPIRISSGGLCSDGAVDLINLGHVAAHLESHDGACHFLRVKLTQTLLRWGANAHLHGDLLLGGVALRLEVVELAGGLELITDQV